MKSWDLDETDEGKLISAEKFQVFFGNAEFNKHDVSARSKGELYSSLHQVHGTDCIEAHGKMHAFADEPQADAQWTNVIGLTLIIKTADCLPILCYDPTDHRAFAIHAGWRGLFDGIVEKSLENVRFKEDLQVFIGPHIHYQNYEVGEEFKDKVRSVFPQTEGILKLYDDKLYLDMTLALEVKLRALGIQKSNVWLSPVDTYTSENHNSYRRSKDKGRNFSLIELF